MIKNLIFDVGGVLFIPKNKLLHPGDRFAQVFDIKNDKGREIYRRFRSEFMNGTVDLREFFATITTELNLAHTIDALYKKWNVAFSRQTDDYNYELLAVIKKLPKKYKKYIFSNMLNPHDEKIVREIDKILNDGFDGVYYSYQIGLSKPDKEAYDFVLKQTNAEPQECLFIDDLEANIEIAKKIGMKTILYTNNENLKKEFKKLGISSSWKE